MQLSNQPACFKLALSALSSSIPPSQAASDISKFYGIENNTDDWVATINALRARKDWTNQQKWCVAIDCLRDGAAAWHRYEGVRQHPGQTGVPSSLPPSDRLAMTSLLPPISTSPRTRIQQQLIADPPAKSQHLEDLLLQGSQHCPLDAHRAGLQDRPL